MGINPTFSESLTTLIMIGPSSYEQGVTRNVGIGSRPHDLLAEFWISFFSVRAIDIKSLKQCPFECLDVSMPSSSVNEVCLVFNKNNRQSHWLVIPWKCVQKEHHRLILKLIP